MEETILILFFLRQVFATDQLYSNDVLLIFGRSLRESVSLMYFSDELTVFSA
jgi:hypothetical protein